MNITGACVTEITGELDTIQADLDKGKIKEAIKALREVLPKANRSKDPSERARTHFLMGKALTRSGDMDESAKEYMMAREIYEEIPDGNGIAETLLGLGVLHRWRSDFATAEEFLNQFLEQATELGNREQVGQAHTELGIVLAERAVYEGAVANFNEAISVLKRTKNAYQLSRAYQSLGEAYKRMGRYIEAFENLEECIKIADSLGLERNIAYASASAAECLAKGGNVDRADRYIERAIKIFDKTEDFLGLSDALRIHAVVEWKKDNPDEAERLFKEAFIALADKDVPANEVQLSFDYAEFLLSKGEFQEAEHLADKAVKMARRLGVVGLENRAWSIKNRVKGAKEPRPKP